MSKDKTVPNLEIEISTRCPVKCPLCPRTNPSPEDKGWNTGFLNKNVVLRFIKDTPSKGLVFCGGYGDPIYHPDFIEIISEIGRIRPDLDVFIETNGSYMKSSWWKKLGHALRKNHILSFSIDGLKDSSPQYRVNSDWDSIIEGIEAVRPYHTGIIQWKWILFRYNENQVKQGYMLAQELGVDQFKLVRSNRHNKETLPTLNFDDVERELDQIQSL